MMKGRVSILIDAQWGSTGKGKLAGYLANRNEISIAAAMTSPNAGHTYVDDTGEKLMFKQLPTAAINKDAAVVMTGHCVLNEERLLEEAESIGCLNRLHIHPNAAIVTKEHKEAEKASLNRVSSTLQGTGAALADRIMRKPEVVASQSRLLAPYVDNDILGLVHGRLQNGGIVLLEMSQGFDLSLTWGHRYPFVTSRDITTASGLNAIGVTPHLLGEVYGSLRTFPIRVGHAFDAEGGKIGDSGPFYDDQQELTWEEVTKLSGYPVPLLERTTVTNKVRRVFTLSMKQLQKFIRICGPTKLFLNFVNYWDHNIEGARDWAGLPDRVKWKVRQLQIAVQDLAAGSVGCPQVRITHLGTGPKDSDMVEVEN